MQQFYSVRAEFADELRTIPWLEVIPSKANYLMCKLVGNISATALTLQLLSKYNILIKDLSGKKGISGEYVRIAVRTQEENRCLVQALQVIAG